MNFKTNSCSFHIAIYTRGIYVHCTVVNLGQICSNTCILKIKQCMKRFQSLPKHFSNSASDMHKISKM